jgi:hypothetical protein
MERPYIEIVGGLGASRPKLDKADLDCIGEFTRENVLTWMNSHRGPDWVGMLPVDDFHAVCGDMDIPWATEEARLAYLAKGPTKAMAENWPKTPQEAARRWRSAMDQPTETNLVHACDRGTPCFACCGGDEAKYQEEWRKWRQRVNGCAICGSDNCDFSRTKERWGLRTCLNCGAQEDAKGWVAQNSASGTGQPVRPATRSRRIFPDLLLPVLVR